MGEVYCARDPKLARDVALKVVRPDRTAGIKGDGARLLREARAAAALSHANVLAVYDVGEVTEPEELRGVAYIAMELVPGKSLRAYVGDGGIAIEKRVAWLADVARALAAAHRRGLVHRDMKPENVMIRDDGAVKVLDFGIARSAPPLASADVVNASVLETLTTKGIVLGTPQYMAPEQMRGEPIDGRADQFAWGVVAYELLTGRLPWRPVGSVSELLLEILRSEVPPPSAWNEAIPLHVDATIRRAMAKSPADRFATMDDLVVALLDGRGAFPPLHMHGAFSPTSEATSTPTEAIGGDTRREVWSPRRWRSVSIAAAATSLSALAMVAALRARATGGYVEDDASRTSTAAPVLACTTNRECVDSHGGEAWLCHRTRRECVRIASEDCKVLAEPSDLRREDTVWLGALFPADPTPFRGEKRAIDMGRRDFARTLGVHSVPDGGEYAARPIAVVMCDETDAERAARHLVDDVQVPAVVGFHSLKAALATIPGVFLPSQTLSMISISQRRELTKIPESLGAARLVWRTSGHQGWQEPAWNAFYAQWVEPRARARGEPMRFAVLTSKAMMDDLVLSSMNIRFNGRSALENGDNLKISGLDPTLIWPARVLRERGGTWT